MHDDQIYLSVITRTLNREVTLSRLMDNLTKQVFVNFEWIIVNDGGDKDSVMKIADAAIKNNISTKVINNGTSQGRSVAANIGVENAIGKYILILDDDDYTHKEYFQKVHDFFEKYPIYGALTCWSHVISEELVGKNIINHGLSGQYTPTINDVSILNLHARNLPTCGLVIRRDVFLKVGGYPVGIDCTEDWAFICKVVLEVNIGVIPEVMAYISKRVNPTGFYKNTTSDSVGINRHFEDETIWKNDRIRASLKTTDLSGLPVFFGELNAQIYEITRRIDIIYSALRKIYRLSGIYYFRLLFQKIKNRIG